jgi:guanylate kinase
MSTKKATKTKNQEKTIKSKDFSGKLILILGPSGTGKGTVINHLKNTFPELVFPASFTTRAMRPNEIPGEVYNFITKEQFQQKIEKNEFLEWAIVHGDNYYGTDKKSILESLELGKTVLREVDIQGVHSLQNLIPEDKIHTIFLTTDSWEKLESRIKKRANIRPEELQSRKESYQNEIQYSHEMEHILYSEDGQIEECNQKAEKIVKNILES